MRILIVGVGNPLRGDDGLGPTAIKILEAMRLPKDVVVQEASPYSLLSVEFENYDKVVLIDAVKRGGKPGTLHYLRLKPESLEGEFKTVFSLHEANLSEILRLKKKMGALSREIIVVGCEPLCLEGLELSKPVRKHLPEIIYKVLLELCS